MRCDRPEMVLDLLIPEERYPLFCSSGNHAGARLDILMPTADAASKLVPTET
jgi:hypothetical protein